MKSCLWLVASIWFSGSLFAAELTVDISPGGNIAMTNFTTALKKAQPGDVIRLLPADKPVNMSLIVKNLKGQPDKPIVIDGSFNVIVGNRPADETAWKEVAAGTGLYRRVLKVIPTGERFFMAFNGKIERMGRHTKWKSAPLKKPDELKDYQWTLGTGNEAYFKLPAEMTPAAARVEEPFYCSGVEMNGDCANIIIRNLIVRRFWNDGYNIHGNCRDVRFENIAAIENADDGISAHETCKITVTNMISINNGTGFCHIQQAECTHENIYIAGSDSRDIFLSNTYNALKNIVVLGNAHGSLEINHGKVRLEDCFFENRRPGVNLTLSQAEVSAERITVAGYGIGKKWPAGVTEAASPEELSAKIEAERHRLFAIFGDKLNSALAH